MTTALRMVSMFDFWLIVTMPPKGKKGKAEKKSKEKEEILRPSEKELVLQAE